MKNLSRRLALLTTTLALIGFGTAHAADTWPSHPITWVVPFSPGGANDLIARVFAKQVGIELKADIIIENRPGAGAVLGSAHVARAKADGYTFLIGSNGTITNSLIHTDQPYKDSQLTPIVMLGVAPSVIVTNPANPANDLKEFVANAKRNRTSRITFSTAGMGSTPDFVGAMVKLETGLPVQQIPYKSGAEGVTAVISNQTDATSEASMVTLPLVKGGKLKALATTWPVKLAAAPGIKTTAEEGYPNIRIGHWEGLYAPTGTPTEILDKMNAAVLQAGKAQAVLDVLNRSSIVAGDQNRTDFTKFTVDERARLTTVVKRANMQPD